MQPENTTYSTKVSIERNFFSAIVLALAIFAFGPMLAVYSQKSVRSGDWVSDVYVDYGFSQPNVVYGRANGIELKLDVYRPRATKEVRRPAMIFFHGGGWRGGSKESYALRVLPWLELGWTVFNVEYRLTGVAPAPASVEDTRCALRWVTENAEKYSVDTNRIVVSGQSAGGHLALMTGLAVDEKAFDANCPGSPLRVAAVVNWFGITDVADLLSGPNKTEFATVWIGASRVGDADFVARVSPISFVSKSSPPVITIHGDKDPLVPYSHAVKLHRLLDSAAVSNELFTVKGGDHGDFSRDDSRRAYAAVRKFLTRRGLITK